MVKCQHKIILMVGYMCVFFTATEIYGIYSGRRSKNERAFEFTSVFVCCLWIKIENRINFYFEQKYDIKFVEYRNLHQ